MTDILLGLIAIAAGLAFCFGGVWLMRLVISVWGAFAGFALGAGLVAALAGEGFLASTLGWVVGLVLALVFGLLAYFFYAVSVVVAMGSAGFAVGSWLMVALGLDWNWLVVLAGVALGVVFAIAALALDLPTTVLIVISAVGGAAVAVSGLMLVFGAIDASTFTNGDFVSLVKDDWWWYALFFVLTIMGILGQSRSVASTRASMREQWASTQSPWGA
jgi:Domain of unknown function (DUF4203)